MIVKKKSIRTLLLLFTMVFAVASFGTTAWAENGTGISPVPENGTSSTGEATSSKQTISSRNPEPSDAPAPSHRVISSRTPERPTSPSKSFVNDKPKSPSNTVSKSSSTVSSNNYVDPDNTISGKGNPSVATRPNTDEKRIDENAAALSSNSPDAESEDWSSLLPESSVSSAASGSMATGGAGTVTSGKSGGLSSLFLLGIALIIAAVCGIGAFIYLQFFSRKHRGGKLGHNEADGRQEDDMDGFEYDPSELKHMPDRYGRNSSYNPQPKENPSSSDPTVVAPPIHPEPNDAADNFTDINSSSDGIQHREEYEEFVQRTRPPIIPKPVSHTGSPLSTQDPDDEETLVLPHISQEEAARRAHQTQINRRRHPPLTSNAIPRNLRGRPAARQISGKNNTPPSAAISHPVASAPAASAQKQSTPPTTPTPPAPPKERKPIPKRKPASKEPETAIKDSTKPAAQQASAVTISGKEPVQAEQNNSDFDWDKFLEENRHE